MEKPWSTDDVNIDELHEKDWEPGCLRTGNGNKINVWDPDPDMIHLEDIAGPLARVCRYAGHTNGCHYSVAQHSVLVSQMVPDEDALWGLLHDAPEAYIQDIPSPIKSVLPRYREIEDRLMWAICEKFGLPHDKPQSVSDADTKIYEWERHSVSYVKGVDMDKFREPPEKIEAWSWKEAEIAFYSMFDFYNDDDFRA